MCIIISNIQDPQTCINTDECNEPEYECEHNVCKGTYLLKLYKQQYFNNIKVLS